MTHSAAGSHEPWISLRHRNLAAWALAAKQQKSSRQTSSLLHERSSFSCYVFITFLFPTKNFQNPYALGTANSWQVLVPIVSNAASLAGSTCNFSTVSASAVSSAWLLPSASGTPFQPLMGSAYPYQQINTGMLSGVSGKNQTFNSTASYPTIIQWDITGSAQKKSSTPGGFTMTVTDQNTAVSSMSVAAQYPNISHTTSTVPLYTYPTFSGRLVKRTPPQGPHHTQSLVSPYQEGSQVHYYSQDTLRGLLSEELGPFVQFYDSMSYTGGRGSALQTYNSTPEMAMVLKEVQPPNALALASTAEFYNSASAQCRPAQSFSENAPQATLKKPTSPPIAPPETSRPAPGQATFSSLQRDPRIQPVTKGQSPPKSQNPFLLKDFSAQRIPWREPNVPEPVISTPITDEQRPEREAMKKKAQWERYNASKYTSIGKVRFFPQRERDINISLYYGYKGVD
ncbi:uncharacterized protein C2orf78-like [Suncus etruscus]|uniref:uncharacterized protein C2orf78-like n=1 Tax=Suncus etruscus TaxID=109475 RepID=UPI00210F27BA|nr:uncharacterized protein C2orf78-like [Suncus etruscus]